MKSISKLRLIFDTPRVLRDSLGYLRELVAVHGDFVHLDAGDTQVVVVAQPQAVGHVLVENWRNYSKQTAQFETFKLVTGNGLLNSDGEFWLQQRRLVQPGFHRRVVVGFGEGMVGEAIELGKKWKKIVNGELRIVNCEQGAAFGEIVVDMEEEMMGLSLRVICDALFGMEMGAFSAEYVHLFAQALDYVMFRAQLPFAFADELPIRVVKEYKAAIAALDELIAQLLADRRARVEIGDDLLGLLLTARGGDGELLSDMVIRDEIMTLIVAGYETVATGMTWMWYQLSKEVELVEQLRQELDAVVGDRQLESGDLEHLTLLRQTMDESFRLIPPSWLISRKALGEDRLGDVLIPKDALVLMSPYAMHHNPRYWHEPERFDVDRFAAASTGSGRAETRTSQQKYQYIPFGAGPRLCIGNRFAEMEALLVMATLLRQFDVEYVGEEPKLVGRITIRPKTPMLMRIKLRR